MSHPKFHKCNDGRRRCMFTLKLQLPLELVEWVEQHTGMTREQAASRLYETCTQDGVSGDLYADTTVKDIGMAEAQDLNEDARVVWYEGEAPSFTRVY